MELITQKFVQRVIEANREASLCEPRKYLYSTKTISLGNLANMRTWLDEHRYEPSTFIYFFLDPGMKIRVAFKVEGEAKAFAHEFGGSLLDTPWATDQVIAV